MTDTKWVAFVALLLISDLVDARVLKIKNLPLIVPDSATYTWVLKDGVQNGLKTSILQLELYGRSSDVTTLLKNQLEKLGDYREETFGSTKVLYQLHRNQFITIQLQASAHTTQAMIMVSDANFNRIKKNIGGLALPQRFQILHVVGKKDSETASISSSLGLTHAAMQLDATLSRHGWHKVSELPTHNVTGLQSYFKKRGEKMWIMLASDPALKSRTVGIINLERGG